MDNELQLTKIINRLSNELAQKTLQLAAAESAAEIWKEQVDSLQEQLDAQDKNKQANKRAD